MKGNATLTGCLSLAAMSLCCGAARAETLMQETDALEVHVDAQGSLVSAAVFSELTSPRVPAPDRSVQETRFANGLVMRVDFNRRTVEVGLRTENGELSVNLVGAQTTSWRPGALGGEEVFFMQADPQWGKEVHGGIPICWPWFGGRGAALPSHGLVRYIPWRLDASSKDGTLAFIAESTPETKALWPHDFRLRAAFSMPAPDTLEVSVTETNTGDAPFESAFGLHPYFALADAEAATLDGVAIPASGGLTKKFPADGRPHVLGDAVRGCKVAVTFDGTDIWRLWNPGEPNRFVAPGEWRRFFCLEPTREKPEPLAPGASRTHRTTFRSAR